MKTSPRGVSTRHVLGAIACSVQSMHWATEKKRPSLPEPELKEEQSRAEGSGKQTESSTFSEELCPQDSGVPHGSKLSPLHEFRRGGSVCISLSTYKFS